MKYRKRTDLEVEVIVEAEQWLPGKQIEGLRYTDTGVYGVDFYGFYRKMVPGDWIITTSKGEKRRIRKDHFRKKYELVEE